MALDWYFAHLRGNRYEEIQKYKEFVLSAERGWREDRSKLLFRRLELIDLPPARPHAVIRLVVRVDYDARRNWTEVDVRPKRRRRDLDALSPRVAWDWVFGALLNDGADSEIDSLLTNLRYQIAYYTVYGVVREFGPKSIGKAPFAGAVSGNRDRLRSQIASYAGITVAELEALPEPDRDDIHDAYSKSSMQRFASRVLDLQRLAAAETPFPATSLVARSDAPGT